MQESASDTAMSSGAVIPPLEIDTLVPCAPDAAFRYFTRDIARWWPLAKHSCSGERAKSVVFEEAPSHRIVETDVDDVRHVWGTVLIWEPGKRLSFTWHPGKPPDPALTVSITFQPAGAQTRVQLVHTGWERLGEDAERSRAAYASGWPVVIGQLYRGYCERSGS